MDTETTDADLVERARTGDDAAFAELYDRWSDRVHSLCARVLDGDAHEAGDAVHDTFLLAWGRLGQLRQPERVGPWLLAIARHESIRRGKRRARARPVETMSDHADVDAEVDGGTGHDRDELARVVWDAAESLNTRDKALLELSLVQEMEGQDLASAAGVDHSQLHVVVARMREHLGSAITALHVARTGRSECATLGELLSAWDGVFSSVVRKRVARHVRGCTVCDQRGRGANPLALGLVLPLAPAPAALRARVISSIGDAPSPGAGAFGHDQDGFPRAARSFRPAWVVAAAALVAILAVAALVVVPGRGADPAQILASETPDTTTTTSVGRGASGVSEASADPTTSTSTTGPAADGASPGSTAVDPQTPATAPAPAPAAGPAPTPSGPDQTTTSTTTTAPPPPPDDDAPVFGQVMVTPDSVFETGGCGAETIAVSATVTDASPLTVTARLHVQGQIVQTRQLSRSGSTWSGSFGPFAPGSLTNGNNAVSAEVRITAVDHPEGAGGPNQSVESGHHVLVNAC